MTRAVANRYVTALADVVLEPESGLTPEDTLDHLHGFADLLRESPDLAGVLRSPAVTPEDKQALLEAVFDRGGVPALIRNFLYIVVEHRRTVHFDLILAGFRAWLDEHRNRVEVEVRVAAEIGSDQEAAIEERFREITGKQVRASFTVDPALLGGSVVRIGSTLYDGSLRSTLGALTRDMAGRNP